MNTMKTLSLSIMIIFMTTAIQASEPLNAVNESSPLVTFNESLNTIITYTPDHEYQKSLRKNIRFIEDNKCQNLSEMSYSETINSFKKGLSQANREKKRWATIKSKRTNDHPFLLKQQEEIKALKEEVSLNKKIIGCLIIGLAVTTATSLYVAYNCHSDQK